LHQQPKKQELKFLKSQKLSRPLRGRDSFWL
jgi:hypothetical protein